MGPLREAVPAKFARAGMRGGSQGRQHGWVAGKCGGAVCREDEALGGLLSRHGRGRLPLISLL
eukprot:349990-Chlamydomonas_euryale.AAC.18